MDWASIEKTVRKLKGEEFKNRPTLTAPDLKGLTNKEAKALKDEHIQKIRNAISPREKRLQHVASQISKHIEFLKARQVKIDKFNKLVSTLHFASTVFGSDDANVLAFDTERASQNIFVKGKRLLFENQITEIGYAFIRNGEIVTENTHMEGVWDKKPFDFGKTQYMRYGKMLDLAKKKINASTYIVGHNIRSDFETLEFNGVFTNQKSIMDTADWFTLLYDHVPSLSEACALCGIDAPTPHNGGNDANYTLKLAMKMAEKRHTLKLIGSTSEIVFDFK